MDRKGFTLIELSVVLAVIGLTATLAAVNLSSSDAALRTHVKDFRFFLEKAKQESLARGVPVELAMEPESRSWVLYVERDGGDGFGVDSVDVLIERFPIPASVIIEGDMALHFTPLGESGAATVEVQVVERVEMAKCASECLSKFYNVRVNHVGGIRVDRPKEEGLCASCDLCGTCY